jgi:hypothetical protein
VKFTTDHEELLQSLDGCVTIAHNESRCAAGNCNIIWDYVPEYLPFPLPFKTASKPNNVNPVQPCYCPHRSHHYTTRQYAKHYTVLIIILIDKSTLKRVFPPDVIYLFDNTEFNAPSTFPVLRFAITLRLQAPTSF